LQTTYHPSSIFYSPQSNLTQFLPHSPSTPPIPLATSSQPSLDLTVRTKSLYQQRTIIRKQTKTAGNLHPKTIHKYPMGEDVPDDLKTDDWSVNKLGRKSACNCMELEFKVCSRSSLTRPFQSQKLIVLFIGLKIV
jgi:hypothetical protein